MNNLIIRGSIWFLTLNPTIGHEEAGIRPCLVVSTNNYNLDSNNTLITIIPITKRFRNIYWRVKIEPPEGGLNQTSYLICDQVKSVSINRFVPNSYLGIINYDTQMKVEERLRYLLELPRF